MVELAMLLVVPLAVIGVGVAALGRRRPVAPTREWSRVVGIRVLGGSVGLVAAVAAASALDRGRGLMLAPAITGLGIVVGVALGETVVRPRRTPGPRSASLRARRVRTYVPRPLGLALAALLALHLVTLALTTATADGGDSYSCVVPGVMAGSHGPYPGSDYSVPLLGVLAVVALVAAVAARVVVRRPRGFAADEDADDALRVRSLTVIVAASGLAVAATHVGIAITAASSLAGVPCAPVWAEPVSTVLAISVPVAFLVACWCAVRLFLNDRLQVTDPTAVR